MIPHSLLIVPYIYFPYTSLIAINNDLHESMQKTKLGA